MTESLSFTICISPVIHLVAPKFCITFAFNFPWVLQVSKQKKTMLMQNVGGGEGGSKQEEDGRCGKGEFLKF